MIALRHGSYVIYVHTEEPPSDEEWNLVLQFYRVTNKGGMRTLVYTAGAAPNAAQRSRLSDVLDGRSLPMAVLTPSLFARAAGTAISWFNPLFRVFGAREFDAAFDHLGATETERVELRRLVDKLKAELQLPTAATA